MSEYQEYGYESSKSTQIEGYVFPVVAKRLEEIGAKCVLDIGCGNGWLVDRLVKNGYDAYGTDASVQGINIANSNHPGRFFVQDVSSQELPVELKDKKFDAIISTEVIEHLYDPASFFEFVGGVIKAQGTEGCEFLVSTPYHGYLKYLTMSLFGRMDKHMLVHWVGGHIKFFSRNTLEEMLRRNGFKVKSFHGCGRLPYLWKSMLITAVVEK